MNPLLILQRWDMTQPNGVDAGSSNGATSGEAKIRKI
jgi:hypothetical protein